MKVTVTWEGVWEFFMWFATISVIVALFQKNYQIATLFAIMECSCGVRILLLKLSKPVMADVSGQNVRISVTREAEPETN